MVLDAKSESLLRAAGLPNRIKPTLYLNPEAAGYLELSAPAVIVDDGDLGVQ